MGGQIDFGYPWWLSYGHLTVALAANCLLIVGLRGKWRRWVVIPLGAVSVWAGVAAVGALFFFNVNAKGSLPTESFFRQGEGRVLDIGAGTGRSSIMVLEARPKATLVASDLFEASYKSHFGEGAMSPEERLRANLRAAGVENRASIQKADMRKLPFGAGEFDAVVSCYAVDHLPLDGIRMALSEAARVLKPGGEFLLVLVGKDRWMRFMFGPLLAHGGLRGADWWGARLDEAGFDLKESGLRPATLYLLAVKPR